MRLSSPARLSFLLLIFTSLCQTSPSVLAQEKGERYLKVVQRPYEDVFEDVEFAVGEHNFRLTGGNHIGSAISQRENRPFPKSDIIHFCNLEYARRFLEAAPDFLLHMPCKVVVYETDQGIVVATQLLPETDQRVLELAKSVNQILQSIVDYATEQ